MQENKINAVDALEDLLKQCDSFCALALVKYVQKSKITEMGLNLDNVGQMQSKIRIGLKVLETLRELIERENRCK